MTSARAFVLLSAAIAASAQAAPPIPKGDVSHEAIRLPVVLDGRSFELEALRIMPSAPGRYPLALITHGSPRSGEARARMSAARLSFQAEELARRGYVAVVVMRRGYGTSQGEWAESYGPCEAPDYERAARASAHDLHAALRTLTSWPQVDASRILVIGQSAGGIASIALATEPPPGLRAVVNFAGGRGSRRPGEVCEEGRLVQAYASLGKTARVPSLWIYTENDRYFGPDLARRMFVAYRAHGGVGELRLLPAFAEDGHALFARRSGAARWRPLVDDFLRRHGLPTWEAPPSEPLVAELPVPHELARHERGHWARYLDSPDNRAFAISPDGRFAWRSGHYSLESARAAALQACGQASCRIVAENDALAPPGALSPEASATSSP